MNIKNPLSRGDRRLSSHRRLALTFAADFGETFKPAHPIVRIGVDALRVEVRREFLGQGVTFGGGWPQPRGSVGLGPFQRGPALAGRRDWPGTIKA